MFGSHRTRHLERVEGLVFWDPKGTGAMGIDNGLNMQIRIYIYICVRFFSLEKTGIWGLSE
jgi:hypothetical protein